MFAEHFHATNYFKYLPDVTTQQSVAITISFAPSSTGSREDYIPSPLFKKNKQQRQEKFFGYDSLDCDNNHIICHKTSASEADCIPQSRRQKFWSGNFSWREGNY